jgi:molybdopterin-containing oxidoreductase family membrane subunit
MWDVFAVNIYATVSLLFWYLGLVPDLATMRDRARSRPRQLVFGLLALGWRGSQRHWFHYEKAYLLLAGLATPLVLSVHSVVSFDFAVSQVPGWHSTIFPPYFVAGAIFSGLAMVVTLMVICRKAFGLEELVTPLHFDRMAKLMLAMSCIIGYAYAVEFFIALRGENPFERFAYLNRAAGPYAWAFWIMVGANVLVPQVFWFGRARTHLAVLFATSIVINVGMWLERFVIVVTSLHRDFLPSSWGMFVPTFWDFATLAGSFGLFLTLFCLFVRYVPMVAIAEVKAATSPRPHHRPSPADATAVIEPEGGSKMYGLVAELQDADSLLRAAEALQRDGYTRWDAHSPYPVHGLERTMGLSHSRVPLYVRPRTRRGGRRVPAPMVGERLGLSPRRQRKAILQLARLRSHHF